MNRESQRKGSLAGPGLCRVCQLPTQHLTQMDLILMSKPETWPETLLAGMNPPDGVITPQWTMFGAVRWAMEYVAQTGLDIRRPTIEAHYRNHLPIVSPTQELIDRAAIPLQPSPLPIMEDYRLYYRDALRMGRAALNALESRIASETANGHPPDMDTLIKVASLGARMAQSQALLVVGKGARFTGEDEDDPEDAKEGFMGERPGPRFGSVRLREIDGEMRAVSDEGPKDRMEYNERADALGAPRLPA